MFVGIVLKPFYCAETLMSWLGERLFNKFSRLSILNTPGQVKNQVFQNKQIYLLLAGKGLRNNIPESWVFILISFKFLSDGT